MTAIIILILLILAAFFLGWLISRLLFKGDSSEGNSDFSVQIADKEAALEACRKQNASLNASLSSVKAAASAKSLVAEAPSIDVAPLVVAPIIAAAAEIASSADSIIDKVDDLKIVEGIGPKIEELLNSAGIKSFAQLANTSVERLKEILEAAGPRYQMHDPGTWPQQSRLADDGNWDELKVLQDELNKGKVD